MLAAALNLIKGGHELTVCDLDKNRGAEHAAMCATSADIAAGTTKGSDIIFTMEFGPKQIESVVSGANGILQGIGKGQIWVDMTTNSPEGGKVLAVAVAAKGAFAIDALVTGAVDGARTGNMVQFAVGEEVAVEHARPAMKLMGPVFYMGGNGT